MSNKISDERPDDYYEDVKWQEEIFFNNLISVLTVVFESYMLLFLLYLVYQFAKNKAQ